MDKVYLVQAGWHYEGSEVILVASSREKAEKYVTDTFEYKHAYPNDSHLKHLQKFFKIGSNYGIYDFIEIEEHTIDVPRVSEY